MKYLKLTVAITILAFLITSCTKTANQGKMVPKEAGLVIVVNGKSLSSKLSWDEIKQTSWFKDKYSDSKTNEWNRKLMENPDLAGVDMKTDQVFFILKNGDEGQVVYVGDIKDSKAFETFNKRFDSTAVPTKDGNLNFLKIHNKAVLGWNDQKFVYVAYAPMKTPSMADVMNGSIPDSIKQMAPVGAEADKLMAVSKRIFGLNSDSSLYKDQKFVRLVNEDGDVHVWVNFEQLSKGSMSKGMVSMMKFDNFLEGTLFTSTLNFDNGKITVKKKTYAGKDLTAIMKKYSGGSVNADMLKNLPSSNLDIAMALHFKPEALQELIKLTGLDGLMNVFMANAGMTIDDFVKANKGDILFALSDLKIPASAATSQKDTSTSLKTIPDMNMVFAISIGDKDAFNKLITFSKKISGNANNDKVVFRNTGQYFVIGNNQKAIDNFLNGNKNAPAFTDKIKDHPGFGYIDIQTILKAFQLATTDTAKQKMFAMNRAMWDNIYIYGGEFSDGGINYTTEINLMDKNTNSLKQLNKFMDQLYSIKKELKKTDRSMSDSTAMPGKNSSSIN